MVYLTRIEGNSRVINLEYSAVSDGFVDDDGLDAVGYYDHFVLTVEKVNLAILALLEELQIDPLTYTLFGGIGNFRRRTAREGNESDEEAIGALLADEQQRAIKE